MIFQKHFTSQKWNSHVNNNALLTFLISFFYDLSDVETFWIEYFQFDNIICESFKVGQLEIVFSICRVTKQSLFICSKKFIWFSFWLTANLW